MRTKDVTAAAVSTRHFSVRLSREGLLAIACILGLAAAPAFIDNFWLRTLTQALMMAGIAQAMNVVYGLGGYPALGNIVFFGVGAYAGTIASATYGFGPLQAVLVGAGCSAALAVVASRAVFGLRGSYFLMATVALNALLLEVVLVARSVTGGALGLKAPPWVTADPGQVYQFFYYSMLASVLFCGGVLFFLRRSRLGFGLLAIRGNEAAAEVLGVPTMTLKTLAWAISAGLTGAIGVVYAHWIGYIDAQTVFSLTFSIEIFLAMLIGGRYLVFGPLVGAMLFESVDTVTSTSLGSMHLGVLGVMVVLFVMFLPNGLPDLGLKLKKVTRKLQTKGNR